MKLRERQRLLELFNDAHFNDKRESMYREDEVFYLLKPSINRDKLKIYLIEFLEKGWIEWDKERSNAYRITDKGILYYSKLSQFSLFNLINPSMTKYNPYSMQIIQVIIGLGIFTFSLLVYLRGC